MTSYRMEVANSGGGGFATWCLKPVKPILKTALEKIGFCELSTISINQTVSTIC